MPKSKNTAQGRVSPMAVALVCFALQLIVPIKSLTDLLPLQLIFKGLFALPAIVLVWLPSPKASIPEKILTTLPLLPLSFAPIFLTHRLVVLVDICLLLFYILAYCFYHIALKRAPHRTGIWIEAILYLFAFLLFRTGNYTFADGSFFPYWQYALGFGLIVSGIITIKWLRKLFRFWAALGCFALISFLIVLLLWVFVLHLNYAFDSSTPQEHILHIEDKHLAFHRKGPDSYYFTFTAGGEEFDLEVSQAEYFQYEVGDTYRVHRYEGAFDKPYYISGKYFEN